MTLLVCGTKCINIKVEKWGSVAATPKNLVSQNVSQRNSHQEMNRSEGGAVRALYYVISNREPLLSQYCHEFGDETGRK